MADDLSQYRQHNRLANHFAGFSLIEVLIAILLFAIILLGFTRYHHALLARHHQFYTQLRAERIAFQLLDSYPNIASHIVPTHWQYQINSYSYSAQCTMVNVTIHLPNQKIIRQHRLFC
ncbi:prepilin-type N-terminal cleavage/methylation domain-containing protein [Orbaceae bacterium ESL0727]|nr:prepilin-type N-terminal cleavage/methylation domain-containing protein [Orbaceae bacterium ESL0727]